MSTIRPVPFGRMDGFRPAASSRSAMRLVVRYSWYPVSGCACRSRRNSMSSGSCPARNASSSPSRSCSAMRCLPVETFLVGSPGCSSAPIRCRRLAAFPSEPRTHSSPLASEAATGRTAMPSATTSAPGPRPVTCPLQNCPGVPRTGNAPGRLYRREPALSYQPYRRQTSAACLVNPRSCSQATSAVRRDHRGAPLAPRAIWSIAYEMLLYWAASYRLGLPVR